MAAGDPLALNALLLLFLLVPGYMALKGYLKASVQLDTTSRIDKLLLGLVGGLVSLTAMLLLNRFGVLAATVDFWYSLWVPRPDQYPIEFHARYAVNPGSLGSITALAGLAFIGTQSFIAYLSGYIYGTYVHVQSDEPQRADKDLEQPWDTALRQSALGDDVTVITKEGEKVIGELYRIGSPSEDYDLLLSAAERIPENGEREPIGVSYHHYRDVSQVHFPRIKPDAPSEESNWLVRKWNCLVAIGNDRWIRLLIHYHYRDLRPAIIAGSWKAHKLSHQLREEEDPSDED